MGHQRQHQFGQHQFGQHWLRLAAMVGVICVMSWGTPTHAAKPHNYAWTPLTHQATLAYRPKISRSDAITALGAPTFAITNADENDIGKALGKDDVVLVWDNGNRCEPIFIGFRKDASVGAKLGRNCAPGAALAIKANWPSMEWVAARCIHKDRRALCRVNAGAVSRPRAVSQP